ncbi:uncharacterized protein METZ01_LOCUS434722, partial [marine metagenome]
MAENFRDKQSEILIGFMSAIAMDLGISPMLNIYL